MTCFARSLAVMPMVPILIKRARGNPEALAAEQIFNIPVSHQHLLSGTEHHRAEAVVDVQDDRGNLRVEFFEFLNEVLLCREDRGSSHQDHHHLAGRKAAAQQDVAQPPGGASLVIDRDFKVRQHSSDVHNDRVRRRILDHAGVNRDHPVAAGLVHTGNDLAPCVQGEGSRDLVPVMGRVLHADDLLHMTEAAQKADLPELLMVQLFLIAHSLKLAAAALFIHGTEFLLAQREHHLSMLSIEIIVTQRPDNVQ